MIKKLCSYPGCHKVLESGTKYCTKHKDTDRIQYKEYKQNRMQDKEEARRQQLYSSDAWIRFKIAQAAGQFGMDLLEYYTTGNIVAAETYHHIDTTTDAWHRRLDQWNVIGLTNRNHARVHAEYRRSFKAKCKMQKILFEILLKHSREFS